MSLSHSAYAYMTNSLRDEAMPAFTVRCVKITKKRTERMLRSPTLVDRVLRGQPSAKKGSGLQEKTQTIPPPEYGSPPVKARATGPLSWVTLLGFFLSASLLIISITLGDGMSLIATLLLSGLSTLIGISNKWELQLPRRPPSTAVPTPGDVVIRYPNGSFLIVKCDEEIARELYFAPEEIVYSIQNETIYRMISLVGTLMLMLGVIFLANAKLQLQFCWGAAYIILNAAHWVAAALPQRLHWDLSCYVLEEQGVEGGPNNTAFTDALFKAILFTGSKDWVRIGKNAAPATETWDRWLREAEFEAQLMQRRCKQKERIKDQLWPKRDANAYGTVWEMPDPKIWNPRDAWQKLDKELKGDKGGTVSATQPVPAHTV